MTLRDFLLERIAEDEADAKQLAVELGRWRREKAANGPDGSQGSIVASTLVGGAFDPARVLAECEARRRIVSMAIPSGWHEGRPTGSGYVDAWWDALSLLALPYADHPDFQEEWKP